ncbi:uncharacterized protein ACWYII_029247 isoform 3-T3 [Salvelinus alpinus]
MAVIVREGRFIAQRITRSITYYYTSRTPGGDSPSPSPPTISPTSSHLDTPLPSPSYSLSTPFLPDLPTHHDVSSILTPSALDVPPLSPSSPSSHRPLLLLLFPWLGARPGAMGKYRDIYLERGLDILSVESTVWHFLWPRWGLEYAAEVLELLDDPRFKGRPLLVHAFSIGGYTFCQLLSQMVREPHKYPGLAQRVIGHVYDSLVIGSLEHMATGEREGKERRPGQDPVPSYRAPGAIHRSALLLALQVPDGALLRQLSPGLLQQPRHCPGALLLLRERRDVRPRHHGGGPRLLEEAGRCCGNQEVEGVCARCSSTLSPRGVPLNTGDIFSLAQHRPPQG